MCGFCEKAETKTHLNMGGTGKDSFHPSQSASQSRSQSEKVGLGEMNP